MLKYAIILSASVLALGACKGENAGTGSAQTSEAPAATATTTGATQPAAAASPASAARKIFKSKCVVCHGDHGAGDGPGAAALNPKPRAFGDATWQASVTDEHITKTIIQGGAAVGKSAAMPPNPDLKNKPEVVAELVKIVRAFKK